MTIRGIVRSGASSRPASWLISVLEQLDSGRPDMLAALTYHHVAEPVPSDLHSGLYVSPTAFEEQLDVLMHRYALISLDELLAVRHSRGRLPRHALLLTFDDAYQDFAATAWPMLRERSLPAVLFVPTGYPDRPGRWFWWERLGHVLGATTTATSLATPLGDLPIASRADRSRAYRLLREHCKAIGVDEAVALVEDIAGQVGTTQARNDVLGWDELRRLASEGLMLAPHSRTHPLLTKIPDDQLVDELVGSREDLERELGRSVPCFAYPSGDVDQRVVSAANTAGYELAFTTRRGVNDLRRGAWTSLRRVNVGQTANSTLLRAQIGRWMALVDR